ncbi:MAG: VWA domain-containing protein [Gammaproteobacteria bacterium]
MDIDFTWPWLLAALPLPFLVMFFIPRAKTTEPASLHFPHYTALQTMLSKKKQSRNNVRLLLATLAWVALVAAATRPQLIGETVHLPITGRSMILAVDISGSMMADDMTVEKKSATRIQAVKFVAGNFIKQRDGDRIGLILFGDNAYLQTPLTFDRKTVGTLLMEAQVGLAGKSTAIGDAIGLAVKRLRDQPEENRVLILMTDGTNTSGNIDPLKAADLAAQEGITIYTIGIGGGAPPVGRFFNRPRIPNGDLDEGMLKSIAQKTHGEYFLASDTQRLQAIYKQLDAIEPVSEDEQSYRPVTELYMWPLATALLLSLLAGLSHRRIFSNAGQSRSRHA